MKLNSVIWLLMISNVYYIIHITLPTCKHSAGFTSAIIRDFNINGNILIFNLMLDISLMLSAETV